MVLVTNGGLKTLGFFGHLDCNEKQTERNKMTYAIHRFFVENVEVGAQIF